MKYSIQRKSEPLQIYQCLTREWVTVKTRRVVFADHWLADKDVRVQLPHRDVYGHPVLIEGITGMTVMAGAYLTPRAMVDAFIAERLPTITAKSWDRAIEKGLTMLPAKAAA